MTRFAIVVVRHPDFANEFEVFTLPTTPLIIDMDYGASDLRNGDEFEGWAAMHQRNADALRDQGFLDAADHVEGNIIQAREEYLGEGS